MRSPKSRLPIFQLHEVFFGQSYNHEQTRENYGSKHLNVKVNKYSIHDINVYNALLGIHEHVQDYIKTEGRERLKTTEKDT